MGMPIIGRVCLRVFAIFPSIVGTGFGGREHERLAAVEIIARSTGQNTCPRDRRLTRIAQYSRPFRRQIGAVAAQSSRLEDLAESFPGLLFALATGYGTAGQRARAIRLIEAGAPLKAAAETLGLPYWLRRLAPDAFQEHLRALPHGPEVCRRIGALIPGAGADVAGWLQRVSRAHRNCHADFALWMARQRRFPSDIEASSIEALLAAWAWHAGRPDAPAHALLRKPWSETMSLKRSIAEAKLWSQRLNLAVALAGGVTDTWFEHGTIRGFQFVPLRTLDDFLSEAAAMNNCLDQYGDQVRFSHTRIFSVRKGGRRIANLEIGPHEDDALIPRIEQLRGPRNKRVPPEIWQATFTWLASQCYRPLPRELTQGERARRQQVSRSLWRPYLDALAEGGDEALLKALALGADHGPEEFSVPDLVCDDADKPRGSAVLVRGTPPGSPQR